ncbi:amine-terminal domain guanylate-binding protein (macronuclear) [Tetrahymena thermophila SB210]|uniref:Amine-terminal domain guanylate-binding protein n=1 Tax=Tetrahymena thermophila (strain SB210) TaxID=312017 RepID=I7M9L3_TETTS|nr:amine-terminal domain guanylate-binding protein [Tetrahymena thermophila SB210]EAS02056.2 amine-terminal domain guanylate-binding protein [Tetrahymena thermophila SB210]|eukprot:XP_001022301.2 amine-terminal domain guanylate-binding protein [Tetrahymena thermophila SB210]
MSQVQGKPILFIDIQEGKDQNNNPTYLFNLTSEAQQLLQQIGERNVAVLVIAGPQRTGKSFLANRFLKQMDGFAIGPTTNPCTKGIWIWSRPVKLNDTTDMIILDTEGLNSVQRDQTIDMKIFSISVLLASMFIYNNLGHIDEQAIENLSLVVRLSENICIQKSTEGDQKLGEFFPLFYWILRDFSLDLKGMTPKEYLEKCLSSLPGNSAEIQKKNEIREKFKQYFRYRDCETLVRPLDDESKLARIELQNWNTLRPEFTQGVINFERKVLANLRPKTIQNKILSGKMFLGLVQEYLQSINTGGIPTILNSLESVISQQVRKEFEDARAEYLRRVNLVFSVDKLPIDEEKFNSTHKAIVDDIFNMLKVKSRNFLDSEQLQVLRKDLQEIMDSEYKIKSTLNTQVSENNSLKIFLNLIQRLSLPTFANSDQIQPNFLIQKYEELQKLLQQYNQQAQGNFKYTIFFQKFPGKIFEFFNAVIGRIYKLFQEDIQKLKVKLQQSNESQDLIRSQIALFEKTNKDLQTEIDEHKNIADQLRRERKLYSAESGGQVDFGKTEEFEMHIDKLNQRIDKLKQENQELQDTLHKTKLDLNDKVLEIQLLKKEIEDLRVIEQSGAGGEMAQQLPDAIGALKDLKQQITQMDDFFSSRSTLNSSVGSVEQHQQEFELYRQEKIKLRLDFKQKLESYKQLVESEKEGLKKNIDVLNSYINELRAKNMQFITQNEEWKKKATVYNDLSDEFNKLKEAFAAKQSNIDSLSQLNQQLQGEIQKLQERQFSIEEQLAEIKIENVEMKSFKEDIFDVMRESLRLVQNKNNSLQNALKRLNEKDIKQLKSCFSSVGIEIK